ncbi:MAG: glycerol-3-phosphate dehydrogenase/oxidase [Cyclobacteriaceae bacterium]|nr:glycerol-3-phosphate dehydrogenase/oxidase [Cyclobacteriaceae bacterium]
MSFSYHQRNSTIAKVQLENFDLLIIGGGITGVGIALDAASRGLKTILVEKNDFAYGTSSRSTKLIHGGLRYLKQFEFALVKEVGSERAVVHRLAPHLVLPEKMLLPLREGRGFGSLLTSFGLWLYDWLAGVRPADRRRMLTRKQTLRAEPLLKKDGVKGGGLYAEYRTDDARLTIEIAKTAYQKGAVLLTYTQVEQFIYANNQVEGVQVSDTLNNTKFTIKAKVVVNAAGPWVDTLRTLDGSKQGKTLHLTKGVHLVVAYQRFPIKQALYFDVADGRMIFAIPRGKTTYIGTTDTDYHADIDEVRVTKADVDYLLNAVNESFPTVKLSEEDVESSWAGLRPLIHETGKSASE